MIQPVTKVPYKDRSEWRRLTSSITAVRRNTTRLRKYIEQHLPDSYALEADDEWLAALAEYADANYTLDTRADAARRLLTLLEGRYKALRSIARLNGLSLESVDKDLSPVDLDDVL